VKKSELQAEPQAVPPLAATPGTAKKGDDARAQEEVRKGSGHKERKVLTKRHTQYKLTITLQESDASSSAALSSQADKRLRKYGGSRRKTDELMHFSLSSPQVSTPSTLPIVVEQQCGKDAEVLSRSQKV